MIGGQPLSDEDWLYPDQPRRPLRTLLMGRRRFVVGMVTVALLVGVSSTAPPGATQSVTGAPAALPYFGLLPAVAYDAIRRQVVLFNNRGETWLWAKNRWTQAHPAVSPSGRIGAAAAWDPLMGAVLLVGGQSYADESVLKDTWTWNGSTWREVGPRTTASPGGFMLAMTYDTDLEAMVLVASDIPVGSPIRLWTWDGAAWHQRNAAGGPASPVAVVAYDPVTETVLAVGARCSTSYCVSDTWSWDGAGWQTSRPPHEPGFAFSSMTLVHDPISGRLILLTIAPTTAGPAPPETWTWNGQDWSWQQTIGQQNAVAVAADGLPGMVLAFEDSSQDFKTQRIDAWEWTGNSWQPIRASSASG